MPNNLPMFLFLSVAAIALFSFVAVASWSDARRREREAYYKTELLKKLADSPAASATAAVELMREDERKDARKKLEGMKLRGLITSAVGVALIVFIHLADPREPAFWIGLVPLSVGLALLVYVYLLAPREWR